MRCSISCLRRPAEQKGDDSLPFIVQVTKTYGSLKEYEEPIEETNEPVEQEVPSDEEQVIEDRTLGQAVKADFTSDNLLEKLHRYKGHIDKTLYKALHELQRMQTARRGQRVSPPQAMDIDINPEINVGPF